MKKLNTGILTLILVVGLSTLVLAREKKDQDMGLGNKGYMAKADQMPAEVEPVKSVGPIVEVPAVKKEVVAPAQDVAEQVMEHMEGMQDSAKVEGAMADAELKNTNPATPIEGSVEFIQTATGVKVMARVAGVTPGKHGFHIHENGSCEDNGNAAGGHFNPMHVDHGFLPLNGNEKAHAGDMGNIEINENGTGELTIELTGVTLTGDNNIVGRAVIVHEKEDDFGQPTGNAGSRIACGVIQAR